MKDIYRQAASVLLLRPSGACSSDGCGAVYQMLLLKKFRGRDAWQLPQGGVEANESIEQAALRELMEEAGIAGARVFGQSTQCYTYDFPASFRCFRPDNVCGQCIKFVFALCPPGVTVAVDGKEIESHAWVLAEQLPLYIKRKEYLKRIEKMLEEARTVLKSKT